MILAAVMMELPNDGYFMRNQGKAGHFLTTLSMHFFSRILPYTTLIKKCAKWLSKLLLYIEKLRIHSDIFGREGWTKVKTTFEIMYS